MSPYCRRWRAELKELAECLEAPTGFEPAIRVLQFQLSHFNESRLNLA